MLVNHPSRGRLERRCERARGFGHIVIHKPRKALGDVARDQGGEEEEELVLPFAQVLDRGKQYGDITFLLTPDHRRRMFARGGQVATVARALNFDQALRAAADRTDRLTERRTL